MSQAEFEVKTYNGISIIVHVTDGYVNASQMCSSNGKLWRQYKTTNIWKRNYDSLKRHILRYVGKPTDLGEQEINTETLISYSLQNVPNTYKGEYIHPRLVHFVAEWCDEEYAWNVADLMDSINDRMHQELANQNLSDTPENAKPAFDNTIQQIQQQIRERQYLIDSQTWGVRGSPLELDGYEKSEMRDAVNAFLKARKQLKDEWGVWLEQYYPELSNI